MLGDLVGVPIVVQIPPEAIGGLTPWITAGALVVFGAERGLAFYQRVRRGNGEKRDSHARSALADTIEQTVRDALSTQQLNFDLSLAEHRNDLRSFFDDLRGEFSQARQEIVQAIRERRR